MAKTATNRSKFMIAGPLPVEAIILAVKTSTRKTMKNYEALDGGFCDAGSHRT
jgi:hypothetical protein